VPFSYERIIHFPDTDAAGVVFFANYLSICHEAYEEALADAGLPVRTFFSDQGVMTIIDHSTAATASASP
jgi:1,4-dihydroxy-2-naphthoyl-CoA hydrolase